LGQIAREVVAKRLPEKDPERKYGTAGVLAFCGQRDAALTLLRLAVERNYCVTLAAENDSLFRSLRGNPEFAQLINQAHQCRERFLQHRRAVGK
jgi:hypothetical protein